MKETTALLAFDNIAYTWPGDSEPVLRLAQLDVPQGRQVFVHGPSGCGKSTLLSLIAGIISPQQGSFKFMGQECTELKPAQRDQLRADHMGYVFQQFNLLPYMSVLDNVTLACHFSAIRKQKAELRSGSVAEEAKRLLGHLQFPRQRLLQPAANLSIGQQQRVAVARALIGSPELIIADEPTSALDGDNRDRFMSLLLKEMSHSDSTLLMVSHDQGLASHFSQVIDLPTLNQGVIHGDD